MHYKKYRFFVNFCLNVVKAKRGRLGISCMIMDASDFEQVILGRSNNIVADDNTLAQLIRDNLAG